MNRSEFSANEALSTSRNTAWSGTLSKPSKTRIYYMQSKRNLSKVWLIIGNAGLWFVVLPLVAKFN